MYSDILISGFGGQGILFAGEVLCRAALAAGLETSWYPSYGPEMRGGTAYCSVIVSSESIASPIVEHPSAVIALNLPSFLKFTSFAKEGALIIANSSLIEEKPDRADLSVAYVPATAIAEEIGGVRAANTVALGALVAKLGLVDLDGLKRALEKQLAAKKPDLYQLNVRAIEAGFAFWESSSGA